MNNQLNLTCQYPVRIAAVILACGLLTQVPSASSRSLDIGPMSVDQVSDALAVGQIKAERRARDGLPGMDNGLGRKCKDINIGTISTKPGYAAPRRNVVVVEVPSGARMSMIAVIRVKITWALFLGIAISVLGGCSMPDPKQDVHAAVNDGKLLVAPREGTRKTITGFTKSLRCMDDLLTDYGIYDTVMLAENLTDSTGQAKAGARDMFFTAISQMTARSHAIKMIAYGAAGDSSTVGTLKLDAGGTKIFTVQPLYDVRGSVSQSDKGVATAKSDVGAKIEAGAGGIGGDILNQTGNDVLGLDLQVLNVADLSLVPGVVSSNQAVISTDAAGTGASASIGNLPKLGLTYELTMSRVEGAGQALRNLIELASIELIGKLTHVPYWSCLPGVDPKQDDIQNTIGDWYVDLNREGIIQYFQRQLYRRGFYKGGDDGHPSAELTQALQNYQQGLGLPPTGRINKPFYIAFITNPTPPVPQVVAQSVPTASQMAKLDIHFSDSSKSTLKRGELFQIVVQPSQDTNVACYYQTEDGKIQRFFPNRFTKGNSLVKASAPLQLPGSMPFKLFASKDGRPEQLACFSSPTSIMPDLAESIRGTDFQNLSVSSLQEVKSGIQQVAGAAMGESYFDIKVQ